MQDANRAGVAASAPETGARRMPQPRSSSRTTLFRLVLLAFLGSVLYAVGRRSAGDAAPEESCVARRPEPASPREGLDEPVLAQARRPTRRRRFATSVAFATLFFAGAALSAGAGDALVGAMEPDTNETTTGTTTTEPIPPQEEPQPAPPAAEEPAAGEPAPDQPASEQPPAEAPPAAEDPAAPSGPPASEDPAAPGADPGLPESSAGEPPAGESPAAPPADPSAPQDGGRSEPANGAAPEAEAPAGPPLVEPHDHEDDEPTRDVDPEAEADGTFATIWLHRTLADPTPPAKRLAPAFAKTLRSEAARAGVRWSSLLGAVRADGNTGRSPATRAQLRELARRLAGHMKDGEWQAFLALRGRTAYADRAQALARYNRAVGLRALVVGFDASKERLADLVLSDSRLDIYGGGRTDIASGKTDVRILVLLRYLAEAHGQVTVSSLTSGHGLYARPGIVSAHVYGLAVDISALGGRPILGNSQPGGVTEHGVRNILLLPTELRPQQLISLLGLGGPSFPMSNHHDHIHVGY
jgi:hypothetical protein